MSDVDLYSTHYSGSGCPPGSASVAVYEVTNASAPIEFALFFSRLGAAMGEGVPAGDRKKSCRVMLKMDMARDMQFSIRGVRFTGYADLALSAAGLQRAVYKFPSGEKRMFETTLSGEFQDTYERTDFDSNAALWSPCGRSVPFMIDADVSVWGNGAHHAFLTADEAFGVMGYRFGMAWRACERPR